MSEPDDADSSTGQDPGTSLQKASGSSPMPFEGLLAPSPADASPPPPARWLAFGGVLLGGLLGGMIGYGIGDILGGTSTMAALGAFIAGLACAVGVGIVASLTLRAMNEWNVTVHPEDKRFRNPS